MRKNQKYTKEEMYLAIDMWKESGLTVEKFCNREQIALGTFKYWQLKYNKEKKANIKSKADSFIPIEVSTSPVQQINSSNFNLDILTIRYTNGTEIICPVNIGLEQLKVLTHL